MELTEAEQAILERYREKTHLAGGARLGYVLRRDAILYHRQRRPDLDWEGALQALVEKGILKASDKGDFYFLSQAGVEALGPGA